MSAMLELTQNFCLINSNRKCTLDHDWQRCNRVQQADHFTQIMQHILFLLGLGYHPEDQIPHPTPLFQKDETLRGEVRAAGCIPFLSN